MTATNNLVTRVDIFPTNGTSSIVANANINIFGMLVINGVKVVRTQKGTFVNMPSVAYTDKQGKTAYRDVAYAMDSQLRNAITKAVMDKFLATNA